MTQLDLTPASTPLLPDLPEVWRQTLGWLPSDEQMQQFQLLYATILAGNRQLNLTRITEPSEFLEKHVWDSLRGIQSVLQNANLTTNLHTDSNLKAIDIGTGAGFPGVPIAIVRPSWQLTLVDSTRKKVDFLNRMLESLGLSHSMAIAARAEDLGQQALYRESFDFAFTRAVAAASVCAEYMLPFLKIGGFAILYRGQWSEAEAEALRSAAILLGGEIESIEAFKTPITQGERHCIYLRKIANTPSAYPRMVGVPAQKPLGA